MANIYEGELTLDHNWGDVLNNGEYAASGDQIQKLVRTELKNRVGYLHCISENNVNNILYGFMDRSSFEEWENAGKDENSSLILSRTNISKGIPEPYYDVKLINAHTSNRFISLEGDIKIPVRFTYTYNEYNESNGELSITPQNEPGTLTIQARPNSNINWENAETMTQQILPNSYDNSNDTTEINITNFIPYNGSWEVRMSVSVDANGDGQKQSSWVYLTVVKTKINIDLTNKWETPQLTPEAINSNKSLNLQFVCEGEGVDKWLNIEISGAGSSNDIIQLHNIEKVTNNQFTYSIKKTISAVYNIYAHGVHNITYWLEIDKNPEFSTSKKTTQIMVVADTTDTTPYILLNNINGTNNNSPLINWSREDIFDYAFYLPDGNGGTLSDVPVEISFKNSEEEEQLSEEINASSGIRYKLERDLSLELTDSDATLFVYCESEKLGWTDNRLMILYVSNTGDYAPSGSADFVFNPRLRSNDESKENLIKIYNTANGERTELKGAKWNGVKFNNTDGWVTDSKNGRCLRLLDKQQLMIPYQPLNVDNDTFGGNFVNTTIELSFAVKNIINDQIPLISICEKTTDEYNNVTVNGFELNASDAYFLPNIIKTRDNLDTHDVVFAEDEKIHMAICINQEYTAGNSADASKLIGTIPDVPGETPFGVTLSSNVRFIRIYINGVLSRVVKFESDKIYDDDSLQRYIYLGNATTGDAADLDIYEIKVFHTSVPKKNYEILKDYIASLSSTEEKDNIIYRNNILKADENNQNVIRNGIIDYNECNKYYNTLLWTVGEKSKDNFARLNGREYGDKDKKSNPYRVGNLKINYLLKDTNGNIIKNSDGTAKIDEDRSGTLYNMSSEGQGTTAMLYFKWNQRYRFDEIDGEKPYFESNNKQIKTKGYYDMFPEDPIIKRLDGKVNWASSMQSHKMGATALYHDLWKKVVGNNGITELNSVDAFNKIDLEKTKSDATTPEDAFAVACKFTGRENGYGSCRVAVHQEPFLLFTQPTSNQEPMFYGMITFGAAKGDKPTFGYNDKFNKHFVMIEGTDNDRPLISCNIPWDDYHFIQQFDDDEVDGGIVYPVGGGSQEQFEISMGDASTEAIGEHWNGANPCLKMFKDMINFCYLHNPNLIMFDGTYEELVLDRESNPDKYDSNNFYWVYEDSESNSSAPSMSAPGATASKKFDVYRWNYNDKDNSGNGSWVPAGLYNMNGDGTKGYYENLNLLTQFGYVINDDAYKKDILVLEKSKLNCFFINKRAARFKEGYKTFNDHKYGYHNDYPNGIEDFVHKNDILFTLQFLKFVAGTDNWSKNTYIYNTGIYYKQNSDGTYMGGSAKYEGLDKFRFFQDDLDTIFEIDNYGAKTKPYYVEEHDYVIKSGKKDPYWNSDYNGMYKLVEYAYNSSENTELKGMMNNILGGMSSLGGNPYDCLNKYFQGKCENAFPEVVFNTTAEQFYMDGFYRGAERANDRYSFFLSQCLGSQKSAETDWQRKRVDYMSSYARYGVFAGGTSGVGIAFKPDTSMKFEMVPHIWMYPIASEGSSNYSATEIFEEAFNVPGRVPAGQKFTISINSNAGSENQVTLKGHDFYRDLGNLARVRPLSSFDINGKRLSKLTIVGTDDNKGILFNPTSFSSSGASNVDNIREINISGKLGQGITSIFNMEQSDLSRLWRLNSLNLSATSIKNVKLPIGSNISTLILPKTTQVLKLDNQTNLTSLELNNSYKSLTTIDITDPSEYIKGQTLDIIKQCKSAGSNLTTLKLSDIDWELSESDSDLFKYIVNIKNLDLSGVINLDYSLGFSEKRELLEKFGNIDDSNNKLYVAYQPESVPARGSILGETYITENGEYQYNISILENVGNDFIGYRWEISNNSYASIDNRTGKLTYKDNQTGDDRNATISYYISGYVQGEIRERMIAQKIIYFEARVPQVGDYVYSDGSVSANDDITPNKTIIGVCYYADNINNDRRMVALNDIAVDAVWGIQYMGGNEGNLSELSDVEITNYEYSKGKSVGTDTYRIAPNEIYDAKTGEFRFGEKTYFDADSAMGSEPIGLIELPKHLSKLLEYKNNDNLVPEGLKNTLAIINHRNNIIENESNNPFSVRLPGKDEWGVVVDEYTDLINLINTYSKTRVIDTEKPYNDMYTIKQGYLYPAASLCYAYEPMVENLNDKFKKHNWYLPTFTELARLWFYMNTIDCEFGKMISANILQRFDDSYETAGPNGNRRKFYWSSTERSIKYAHCIQPRTTSNAPYIYIGIETYKCAQPGPGENYSQFRIRPVARF